MRTRANPCATPPSASCARRPASRSTPTLLGEPIAQSTIEFSWAGYRITQGQTFFAVLVESAEVSLDGLDHWEQASIDKYGWLSAEDLEADDLEAGEGPADAQIPGLIRAAVASVRARPR